VLIMILFRLRKSMGIGLLFATLGLFQFMQVFLSSTVYVEISRGIIVSPGSSVLFTASLFAVLLIYIKEDASETRKIIYALVISNIVMAFLLQSFSWNIEETSFYNPFKVSTELFDNNAWVLFIGTLALLLDSLLIIIIYEFISKHISKLFLRISVTMLLVVGFDSVFFSIGAFWRFEEFYTILISGLISKSVATVFYSILFTIYLRFFEKDVVKDINPTINDVFSYLSYRQKFEVAVKDSMIAKEEAQLNEIKYQTLTDNSPVGIFHTRSDGFTTYVNPRWCDISGIPKEMALGDGWLNAVHPDDREKIKRNWDKAVIEKCKSETEYRFIHSDSSIRWILGQAIPELNSENQIIGYIGTITDITELKLYELEQSRLKDKAEESDRLKSAFLANMSHEIRTPMNGILGFAELLKDPKLTGDEQQKYLSIIEKSGFRMLNIINEIVDISKIESGLMEINIKDMNIIEQMESIYTFFMPEAESKGLRITFENSANEKEIIIKTDREKFYAIMTNLIKNSIKYTHRGYIKFGFIKKDEFLEFFVKDSGIGILKDRQDAIFNRFVQADIEDKHAYQGAGLGLSIAKCYVEMLGGKIWVESNEIKGSKFSFTLPNNFGPNQYTNIDIDNPAIEIEKQKLNEDLKLKILIAEDDETSEMLTEKIIEKFSKNIIKVKTGVEAVNEIHKNKDINLVLMDIRMPKMDGYEATRLIREFNKDVIIIAQTAYGLKGDREKAIEAGCNDYISKPIVKKEFITLLKKYFNKIEY